MVRWFLFAVFSVFSLGCGNDDETDSWPYGPFEAGVESGQDDVSVLPDAGVPDAALPDVVHDSSTDVSEPVDADVVPQGPTLYPPDRRHSPLTSFVVSSLETILANNPSSHKDRFLKVGDSITVSNSFLHCFAGGKVDLGTHVELQSSLDAFSSVVQGTTCFNRVSTSAQSGKTASWVATGTPSPIDQEMAALQAGMAVVMFGTNDIGWFGDDHVKTLSWYHDAMLGLVDRLMDAGVVPILSSIPPRDDAPSHDAWVSLFNTVIRAMAQGRQVPFVDFHRELVGIPSHGLSGDGVHPNAFSGGACSFGESGLNYGYNVRNLITLEALDRVWRAVVQGESAPDDGVILQGTGTIADPFLIPHAVFTDMRSTADATSQQLDRYDCSPADESGPEYVYRFEVQGTKKLRAVVMDRGKVDADLHLLGESVGETGCLARGDTLVEKELSQGVYHLVVDTFVSGGEALVGEYLLAVELR